MYSTNAGGWFFTIGNFPVYINVDTGVVTLDKSSVGTQLATTANDQVKGSYSWKHLAITRNSAGLIRVFMNGVLLGSVSTSYSAGTLNGLGQYATYGGAWQGYISDFRVLVGTALYTSAFTPPTAPLVSISNTSFLLNLNNPAIVDISSRNVLETVGDAKIVTSTRKYGTGSMYFDGTGDYLASYSDLTKSNCTFRTGDFTIEAWVNFATVGTNLGIADTATNTTGGSNVQWYMFRRSTNVIGFGIHGADPIISSTTNTAASTWYHLAVTRSGTSVRMFINGVLESSTTNSTDLVAASLQLGLVATPYSMHGYIDDFRITKGVARYTANFTPPTTTFLTR